MAERVVDLGPLHDNLPANGVAASTSHRPGHMMQNRQPACLVHFQMSGTNVRNFFRNPEQAVMVTPGETLEEWEGERNEFA